MSSISDVLDICHVQTEVGAGSPRACHAVTIGASVQTSMRTSCVRFIFDAFSGRGDAYSCMSRWNDRRHCADLLAFGFQAVDRTVSTICNSITGRQRDLIHTLNGNSLVNA